MAAEQTVRIVEIDNSVIVERNESGPVIAEINGKKDIHVNRLTMNVTNTTNITSGPDAPSGGSDGDVHFQTLS
jgi:hypothetical protein